ncbi:membrane fusion protein (multidrug efflux system) [Rhizobium sp. BK529]|uniref:HlyD family secretion protein n=1 Tax=Rhizobium sp. BK529 TaxID=2586983 RepID=UPI0016193FDE|nr:HlyD family secretion protein [Rhizobium sp. BK529]MBB3595161.1 membrane fusion protein (multidrug efflux system) [Rhizobium sp. BK529]
MGWGEWVAGRIDQRTDDAYLKADTSPISSQISGQVKAVLVGDFEPVKAGDELVQIDDSDYAAQLARAKAAIGSAEAKIQNADSQIVLQQKIIAQSEAVVGEVVADRDRARAEYDRQQAASSEGWTTAQKRENAVADLRRFEAQLIEKQADVDAQRHKIDVLQTQKQQAEAELASRKADLEIARINLARTRIVSPINGFASASRVRIGQFVSAGTRVIDVVPLPYLYVLANYKETQLSRIRPGQTATLTIDAFPGHMLTGHVVDLSPASGSEFALLPPDNATGNFTKVAQRIAVRIEIDHADGLGNLLRPGMSVVPTIHTDEKVSLAN